MEPILTKTKTSVFCSSLLLLFFRQKILFFKRALKKHKVQAFFAVLVLETTNTISKRIEECKGQVFFAIIILVTTNSTFQRESKSGKDARTSLLF
jgi:hypothetical protein